VALRRAAPPAAVIQRISRTLRARSFLTKAPPRVATKATVRGAPKLLKVPKPIARVARIPGRIARTVAGGALAGTAFIAGEQFARRKLFKPTPSPTPSGARARGVGPTIPDDGGIPAPVVGGALAGGLIPAAKILTTRGKVGRTMGIVSGVAGLARKAAVPALAGVGVVAIGGQVVDSETGQVIGLRRVKRSRIGFKRSDLKAFNRVISTAKRVKKILTKAGMGKTFRTSARISHATLSREHMK